MTFGSGRWRLNLGASGRLRTFDNVMFGAAGAAAAGSYIPGPSVGKAVAAILAVFSGYAGWAYNRGGCLAVVPAARPGAQTARHTNSLAVERERRDRSCDLTVPSFGGQPSVCGCVLSTSYVD